MTSEKETFWWHYGIISPIRKLLLTHKNILFLSPPLIECISQLPPLHYLLVSVQRVLGPVEAMHHNTSETKYLYIHYLIISSQPLQCTVSDDNITFTVATKEHSSVTGIFLVQRVEGYEMWLRTLERRWTQ